MDAMHALGGTVSAGPDLCDGRLAEGGVVLMAMNAGIQALLFIVLQLNVALDALSR